MVTPMIYNLVHKLEVVEESLQVRGVLLIVMRLGVLLDRCCTRLRRDIDARLVKKIAVHAEKGSSCTLAKQPSFPRRHAGMLYLPTQVMGSSTASHGAIRVHRHRGPLEQG